jgi:hypothetical protein
MVLRIRYIDFWPGFQPESFVFTNVLREISGSPVEIVNDHKKEVDIQFNSVFCFGSINEKVSLKLGSMVSKEKLIDYQSRSTRFHRCNDNLPAKKYVWYTGENKRAPVRLFDQTISFDKTDTGFNNLYFPYWMARIDWGYGKGEFEVMPTIEELMQGRTPLERPLTACTFSSKIDSGREKVLIAIEDSIKVSRFGTQYGNPVLSKHKISQEFGFQICLENEVSPGYVTEKIQEAWMSRNVPIWAGIQTIPFFNKEAFIDVTSLSRAEIGDRMKRVTTEEMKEIQSKPALIIEPSLDPLKELLGKCL